MRVVVTDWVSPVSWWTASHLTSSPAMSALTGKVRVETVMRAWSPSTLVLVLASSSSGDPFLLQERTGEGLPPLIINQLIN